MQSCYVQIKVKYVVKLMQIGKGRLFVCVYFWDRERERDRDRDRETERERDENYKSLA